MPVFNVASVFGGKKKGGGKKGSAELYNALTDELTILENALETDGELSPGDYKLLTEHAQTLYSNPALTPTQRSNINVKISQYQKGRGVATIKQSTDTTDLDNELKDSQIENVRALGNSPLDFAQANYDAAVAKVARISDKIDTTEDAGANATKLRLEYANAINEARDAQQVIQDMSTHQKGGPPNSKKVAFITTNDNGEIVDVKFGRPGEQAKFAPTNGTYGGLQVYGLPNGVENGNKVFRLGDTTFDAPDILEPDPNNPLATRVRPLIAKDTQRQAGKTDLAQIGIYKDFDQSNMRTQSFVSEGGWMKGEKGALYKKENGRYTKYINTTLEEQGINENSVIAIPKSYEKSIINDVTDTKDIAALKVQATPAVNAAMVGGNAGMVEQTPGDPSQTAAPVTGLPGPTSRVSPSTNQPTERAPSSAGGVAARTVKGAKNYLASIFG